VIVFRIYLVLMLTCIMSTARVVQVVAQQSAPPTPLNTTEKSGRSIFQTRCAMCHVGQEPATEMATPAAERRPATMGPLLSKANTTNDSALRLKIKDGSRLMPGYKHTLTDEQIDQVIAFMKTIERPLTRIATARAGE
jgi:mono/diheme cytochrome c family protein